MNRQYRILTVTKSHWDREWYMNFQKTRVRLLHLIDTVLDLLDDDPDFVSFMLDHGSSRRLTAFQRSGDGLPCRMP